jgi:hypothetical protein
MILAFGNKARQGKNTACNAVLSYYATQSKFQIKSVNFADALRKEVTTAISEHGSAKEFFNRGYFGVSLLNPLGVCIPDWVVADPNPDMADPLLPYGKHPKLLQWWGTEYRRKQSPNYWVERWREQVVGFKGIVVTGDLRFLNEAAAVKELGGYTINVTCLNKDGTVYISSDRPANHSSETELDGYNWDFFIRSKSSDLTESMTITIAEYIRRL